MDSWICVSCVCISYFKEKKNSADVTKKKFIVCHFCSYTQHVASHFGLKVSARNILKLTLQTVHQVLTNISCGFDEKSRRFYISPVLVVNFWQDIHFLMHLCFVSPPPSTEWTFNDICYFAMLAKIFKTKLLACKSPFTVQRFVFTHCFYSTWSNLTWIILCSEYITLVLELLS